MPGICVLLFGNTWLY